MKRSRKVKHEIPDGKELVDFLPEGIKFKVVGNTLILWVKKWPHEEAERIIKWFAERGIPNKWAEGNL